VDVDDEYLRAVIVREGMGGASITAAREWPLPKPDTAEERAAALGQALAQLKTTAGSSPSPAWVTAVDGSRVCLRLIQVPPVPRGELKGAVMWEARTQVPFPLDRALADHVLLAETEREGGARQLLIMLGAAQEEEVLERLKPFQAAGARLSALAPTAAVLWSGRKQLADLPAGEAFAIVHTGDRTTTICVGKGDQLDFTREIAQAPTAFVSADAAPGEEHPLVRELRRSFDYHQERHGGERITTVVLSGRIGCEPGASARLASLLGCTVKTADPLGRLGLASSAPEIAGRSAAFAVAAAAALSGRGLNLLPPHLRPRAPVPVRRALVAAGALLVLGAGYHHWSLITAEATYRPLAERSEADLRQLKSREDEIAKLKEQEARLERLSKQVPHAPTEPIAWREVFQDVAQGLPANVTLKSLSLASPEPGDRPSDATAMKVSLAGVVFGNESEALVTLSAVIESLQATGWFGGVRVSAPIRKTKEYTRPASEFGLTFEVVLATKGKPK